MRDEHKPVSPRKVERMKNIASTELSDSMTPSEVPGVTREGMPRTEKVIEEIKAFKRNL